MAVLQASCQMSEVAVRDGVGVPYCKEYLVLYFLTQYKKGCKDGVSGVL